MASGRPVSVSCDYWKAGALSTPEEQAGDPTTPGAVLQQIAAERADLREIIAKNPACYPALRDWIGQQEKPPEDFKQEEEPSPAVLAADPNTPSEVLQDIAAKHPELGQVILKNPSCYPALAEWIRSQAEVSPDSLDITQISTLRPITSVEQAPSTEEESSKTADKSKRSFPKRASKRDADEDEGEAPAQSGAVDPSKEPETPDAAGAEPSRKSNLGLWIAFGVLSVFAAASAGFAIYLLLT